MIYTSFSIAKINHYKSCCLENVHLLFSNHLIVRQVSFSIGIFIFFLQGFFNGSVSRSFALADNPNEWEYVEEEAAPEKDDLDEKPNGTIWLCFLALFTVFTEIGHVGDGINNKTEESVRGHDIP